MLFLLETGAIDGCIVTKCEGETPLVARSFIARNPAEVLAARGSKYAPVSACTVLREVIERPGKYVFVGSPCMIEGLHRLTAQYPVLRERVALTIGFVCAGMASRLSTKTYIVDGGRVDLAAVRRISYRGSGWPGRFRVFGENDHLLMDRPLIGGSLTHLVGKDHYLRCYNCLDHWAQYADITVSDPWKKEMLAHETQGWSAVMVRTDRGQRAVSDAVNAGALVGKEIPTVEMVSFNKHLALAPDHPRYVWRLVYQTVFLFNLGLLPELFRRVFRGQMFGIITTLRAKLSRSYYY